MADIQDVSTLVSKLNDMETFRDPRVLRSNIYEILNLSTNGFDISSALPTVVKLLAHSDAFVKRVAGEIIAGHAEQNPEIVLLATNTLVQDCKDVNPVVRGLGFRILGSLHSDQTAEMLSTAVVEGLEDSSAYVRRCASLATSSLYQISPTSVTDGGIWDQLYRHLSDSDPATVAGCMCALEDIFSKEKGIVISNKLGQYLINSLPLCTPTVQRVVLQFLQKHSPKSKAQVFEHLNDLDESLSKSPSLATVLCSLELFCQLTDSLPKVKAKAYATAWSNIKVNLARERNEETVSAVLDYLSSTNFPLEICVQDFNKFFCRDDDSQYLMKQKIRMLCRMITVDNVEQILEEFVSCAKRLDLVTVREMVQSVTGEMALKSQLETACASFLRTLLQLGNPNVLECVIKVLSTVSFTEERHWEMLAPSLSENYSQVKSSEGKAALLDVIRSHNIMLDNVSEILEQIMYELEEEIEEGKESQKHRQHSIQNQKQLKLSLLSAMVRVCLEKPAQIQPLLARLMELCVNDTDRYVRDRALFLYGYLLGRAKQKM